MSAPTMHSPWQLVEFMHDSFDRLNPISKLMCFRGSDGAPEHAVDAVLITLHRIDRVFEESFGYSGVYVLEDQRLKGIISDISGTPLADCERALLALHISQLIYRFTAAKRFGLSDDSIKQIRINSWGREYMVEFGTRRQPVLETKSRIVVDSILEYFGTYKEIVGLLRSPVSTDRHRQELMDLQSSLPFRIVQ